MIRQFIGAVCHTRQCVRGSIPTLFVIGIGTTCLVQPTDRDQLTVLGQNNVDLLQIRVPGHESGKACTLDSNSYGITESSAAWGVLTRNVLPYFRVYLTRPLGFSSHRW